MIEMHIIAGIVLIAIAIGIGLIGGVVISANKYEHDKDSLRDSYENREDHLYEIINNLRREIDEKRDELNDFAEKYDSIAEERDSLMRDRNDILEAVHQVRDKLETLFRKKEDDHQFDLECSNCYWRTQMKRDRDDYMNTIAAKEAIVKNLQATIKELKEKNPIGFNM